MVGKNYSGISIPRDRTVKTDMKSLEELLKALNKDPKLTGQAKSSQNIADYEKLNSENLELYEIVTLRAEQLNLYSQKITTLEGDLEESKKEKNELKNKLSISEMEYSSNINSLKEEVQHYRDLYNDHQNHSADHKK